MLIFYIHNKSRTHAPELTQLTPTGHNFAISHMCIASFPAWLETWNIIL